MYHWACSRQIACSAYLSGKCRRNCFWISDARGSNETLGAHFHWKTEKLFPKKALLLQQDRYGEQSSFQVNELFRIRKDHESSAIDAGLKRLIGHKICFFFWQSQASIRMSRGTGSLRVASEGLSCPFLKTFAVVFFWPTALWRQKWGDEWDIKVRDECIKWHEVYQIASSRCNNSTSTRFAEVQFKLLSRRNNRPLNS